MPGSSPDDLLREYEVLDIKEFNDFIKTFHQAMEKQMPALRQLQATNFISWFTGKNNELVKAERIADNKIRDLSFEILQAEKMLNNEEQEEFLSIKEEKKKLAEEKKLAYEEEEEEKKESEDSLSEINPEDGEEEEEKEELTEHHRLPIERKAEA